MADRRGASSFSLRCAALDAVAVVRVAGAVDLDAAPALRAVLADAVERHEAVLVDLEETTLLDAHSIGMLVSTQRMATAHGCAMQMYGARGRVLRVLEITGTSKMLIAVVADPFCGRQPEDRTVQVLLRAGRRDDHDAVVTALTRSLAIEAGYDFAARLARAYRGRGEAADDLTQVAMVGLIKAVDGYDPDRGSPFHAYAVPTVLGEIKRHFRDKGWQIRVPRRMQEIGMAVQAATGVLSQQLGRAPTAADVALNVGVSQREVAEAAEAAGAYRPTSLALPIGDDGMAGELGDVIGAVDPAFDLVEYRESLRNLLGELPERQQRILQLRFYGNLTQSQIAERVGVSQMHVSRLLKETLERLRTSLLDAD